jgi:hypothetical protein
MALAVAATVAAVSVVGWVALTTMPVATTAIAAARQAASVRAADARRPVDNSIYWCIRVFADHRHPGVRPYLRAVAASEPDARP